jgi:hypothetical protein
MNFQRHRRCYLRRDLSLASECPFISRAATRDPSCRCNNRRSSSWSSASTPPRRSVVIPSSFLLRADEVFEEDGHFRYWQILFAKIENRTTPKSREGRLLIDSPAAKLSRADTKARGRFCVKRCGPSCRRVRNASAVLTIFVRQPEKTFSTLSARTGPTGPV